MTEFDVALHRALKKFQSAGSVQVKETPPHGEPADLTVAIATYDDFDGAYFTIHSILVHHREVLDRVEFVLLDNNPEGLPAPMLESFAGYIDRFRYVPFTDVRSTAVRDVLFRKATGKYVLVLDSHVILAPGSLSALLAYFDADPETDDLIQGPMLSQDSSHIAATHMDPKWRNGMFGSWGVDPRAKQHPDVPFEIVMQGLGSFACRREAWPGLNSHFTGFGGEEGYIHEKFRINGGKVVCLPTFGWHHRFERPAGVPYRINWEDRVHNYLLGWSEVGWDLDSLHRQFSRYLGDSYPEIRRRAELSVQRPELVFGGVVVLSDDGRVAPWRSCLAEAESIELTVHRAIPAEDDGPDGWRTASAFVAGLDKAILLGWKSVVFLDEARVIEPAVMYKLRNIVDDLPAEADTAVIHAHGEDLVGAALIVRAATYGTLRDELSRRINGPVPSDFSLAAYLLERGAVDVVLDRPLSPVRVGREPNPVVEDSQSDLGVAVVNLDLDIDRWKASWHRFIRLPRVTAVERVSAFEDAMNQDAAFTVSWRRALARATEKGWDSVLIAADDVSLLDAAASLLGHAREELDHGDWDVVHLGHDPKSRDGALLDGSALLRTSPENRGVHAVLVHSRAFERILDEIADPESDPEAFGQWAGHYRTLGDYLVDASAGGALTCLTLSPGIASTRSLIRSGAIESEYSRRFAL
ncbi:glycosyltransferase family 2 protein [Rhodococcus qingshengii]|uniref:glycosyltransferase family 2 protein n=1 Tax=Rhodococcus qingshengii TaxID=334542 RepID=UPI0021BB834E|nr:glycosyltransferase family 2 protein [Rhodococcus qingshengii]UXF64717.1 glycosyltransferase family 2 protein [Rhodococcus qingshengii]